MKKSLRQKDEDLFEYKIKQYNIIVSSNVYKEYLQLKEKFEKIKCQNEALVEQLKNAPRNNIGFFEKIYNILFRKRLSEQLNGEKIILKENNKNDSFSEIRRY